MVESSNFKNIREKLLGTPGVEIEIQRRFQRSFRQRLLQYNGKRTVPLGRGGTRFLLAASAAVLPLPATATTTSPSPPRIFRVRTTVSERQSRFSPSDVCVCVSSSHDNTVKLSELNFRSQDFVTTHRNGLFWIACVCEIHCFPLSSAHFRPLRTATRCWAREEASPRPTTWSSC